MGLFGEKRFADVPEFVCVDEERRVGGHSDSLYEAARALSVAAGERIPTGNVFEGPRYNWGKRGAARPYLESAFPELLKATEVGPVCLYEIQSAPEFVENSPSLRKLFAENSGALRAAIQVFLVAAVAAQPWNASSFECLTKWCPRCERHGEHLVRRAPPTEGARL